MNTLLIIFNLLIALLIPPLLGMSLLFYIFRRDSIPAMAFLSLSYGTGWGILTQCMFIVGALGVPYDKLTLVLPAALLSLAIPFANRKIILKIFSLGIRHAFSDACNLFKNSSISHFIFLLFNFGLICFTGYIIAIVFWFNFNYPLTGFDPLAYIALIAKAYFYHHNLVNLQEFDFVAYPLHVPLSLAWISLNLGYWSDQLVRAVFPFTLLAYLAINYYFLKTFCNHTWAALGTVLFISANCVITMAVVSTSDFTLMYYNCTTLILILLWNKYLKLSWLTLAGLFSGFTSFLKLEGTMYVVIHILILLGVLCQYTALSNKEKIKHFLYFCLLSLSLTSFYYIYKITLHLPAGKTSLMPSLSNMERIPIIIHSFFLYTVLNADWNIIWFLAFLSVTLSWNRRLTEARIIFFSLFLFFSSYFFVALLTSEFVWLTGRNAEDVLPRVILHFFPLSIWLICLLNYRPSLLK